MSWDRAISFTLPWEGGLSDHPADRGGLTNMGITQTTLNRAYKKGTVKHNNVRALSKSEARIIYKAFYWAPFAWDRYTEPIDMILFDCCVNHGMGGTADIVQRACVSLGTSLTIDGKWGPQTRGVLYEVAWKNGLALSKMLITKRLAFYDRIVAARASQKSFLKGWRNRTLALAKACGVRIA